MSMRDPSERAIAKWDHTFDKVEIDYLAGTLKDRSDQGWELVSTNTIETESSYAGRIALFWKRLRQ